MDQLLLFLLVLLGGVGIGYIAHRLKIPDALPLILAGFLIPAPGVDLVNLVAVVALAVIAFDSAYHYGMDPLTKRFSLLSISFVFLMFFLFGLYFNQGYFVSLFGAVLASGSGLLVFLLPFLLLDYSMSLYPLLFKILAGLGSGLLVGFIAFKSVHLYKVKLYQGLLMGFASILGFVLAEFMGGYGIVASLVIAFFYARYVKADVDHSFANLLCIVVYVFLGAFIHPSLLELVAGLFLFALYVLVRLIVDSLVLKECGVARATAFPVKSLAVLLLFFASFPLAGVLLSFLIVALVGRWVFRNAGFS